MLKKIGVLAFALSLLAIVPPVLAQTASQEARWEGTVLRSSKDQSTLTVRSRNGQEKIIHYDSSTRWVSQKHGSKTVTDIDPTQVKDGDRVIVRGTQDHKGKFHAAQISKRLTPLPGETH